MISFLTISLIALLLIDSIVHLFSLRTHGLSDNLPNAVFGLIYGILALIVALAIPYSIMAVLALCGFGFVGLTLSWEAMTERHGIPLYRTIWWLDLLILLSASAILVSTYL